MDGARGLTSTRRLRSQEEPKPMSRKGEVAGIQKRMGTQHMIWRSVQQSWGLERS